MKQIHEILQKPEITCFGLSAKAIEILNQAGVTPESWVEKWFGKPGPFGPHWSGDECGCPDDRCIGYHHGSSDDCGCLASLLTDPYWWGDAA